ncbi:MAG: hypothetical protein IPN86_22390 [Saprospiraceae bacterium]|jgi:hypothetical protein|nr:hypothetical protein [Saprospiraceae bacterium]
MLEHFSNLNEDETKQLLDALPLITVLIAGADGNFEKDEMDWAEKVTHIRSYKLKGEFKTFYEEVDNNFLEKVQYFMDAMPEGVTERTEMIDQRLKALNPILAKLDPAIGSKLYAGFVSFAEHIAKASGGVMGFFSINHAESKLIGLPMLDPIIYEGDEEE